MISQLNDMILLSPCLFVKLGFHCTEQQTPYLTLVDTYNLHSCLESWNCNELYSLLRLY